MMPDASRRGRGDKQNGQEQSENDAPGFDVSKNAHAIQRTGVDALIVGQTCGENNWLHSGRFLTLTLQWLWFHSEGHRPKLIHRSKNFLWEW